ncbi:cathepsin S-like [Hyperolius riggenbachi]|uniref:cathepsin S-like n=1 Tax=Hyperolius riggenbachi TaxID=752182 RepID=UPI0035A28910
MHYLVFHLVGLLAFAKSIFCSPDVSLDHHWKLWLNRYQRAYNNEGEELERRMIWEDNLKFIMIHNLEHSLGLHSYEVGMNHLGDMKSNEVSATMMGFSPYETSVSNATTVPEDAVKSKTPETKDWRTLNCVTDVKAQEGCSCDWAFSTVGALECQVKLRKGKLESFSAQNLVDCSRTYGNSGCEGGFLVAAYRYIINNGLQLDSTYPYEGQEAQCHFDVKKKAISVTSYKQVPYGDENELKEVVGRVGPVSVAVDASQRSFFFYKKGVYYEPLCSTAHPNHAVLVVGYGSEDGVEYWLLKNSWGPSFGEQGYIKLARNHYNHCGIASFGVYPVL